MSIQRYLAKPKQMAKTWSFTLFFSLRFKKEQNHSIIRWLRIGQKMRIFWWIGNLRIWSIYRIPLWCKKLRSNIMKWWIAGIDCTRFFHFIQKSLNHNRFLYTDLNGFIFCLQVDVFLAAGPGYVKWFHGVIRSIMRMSMLVMIV